ncbi:MAG: hypothetical protein AAF317_02000 [Pseudomonadota bacterium]
MAMLRVLSIAVASGRAGYVLLEGRQLLDWGIAIKATKTGTDFVGFVQELINTLKPDVVVTEATNERSRKGDRVKALIRSIAELASHNEVLDVSVERPRAFPSKYDEAADIVTRHPDIRGYLPDRKRRVFDFEPRSMILFEAIAFAEAVLAGAPEQLAKAMG